MSTINKSAAIQKIKQAQQAQQGGKASKSEHSSSSSSSHRLVTRKSKWAVDLTNDRVSTQALLTSGGTASELIPMGYSPSSSSVSSFDSSPVEEKSSRDEAKQADLLYKSAMAMATAPGKQLMMTAFMLWMSGNSLQIFSIMMLGMALWTPLSEIMNISNKFARYSDSGIDLIVPKLTFIATNMAGLALGLYKCNSMGLLPTSSADWLDTSVIAAAQVAGGGIVSQ